MTKSQIIAQSGGDYDDNVSELAREQQLAKDAGLTLDKDLGLIPASSPTPSSPDPFTEPNL
jgi:capsid protein